MIFGVLFAFWRFAQIITLIPTLGMLAYFVHGYREANELTPDSILVLFIVSVLACAWAVATLFTYHRSRNNSLFVSIIDLLFVGAFIGAVYALRAAATWDCTDWSRGGTIASGSSDIGSFSINGLSVRTNRTCAMLKASFAFGIMNIIFFFITAILAALVGRGGSDKRYVKETHYTTSRGHRRSGSHRSHRSSHSGRRHAYV
jgi:uncharacterized membrane-anchored protein YitT (DUF2179 family)